MSLDTLSAPSQVPEHVAIIMDGNGRWAKARGLPRIDGHKAGARSVRQVVEASRRLGVRFLTLFSFSTENWGRSTDEVGGLMELFKFYLETELGSLIDNGVRLRAVGDLSLLPKSVRVALEQAISRTESNQGLDLVLAMSYGGRAEILQAVRCLAQAVASGELQCDKIDEGVFSGALWTSGIPDPDLLIRSSGELRISNFLLWQLAYTEIVVAKELWPEFTSEVYLRCLWEYSSRERRFGLESGTNGEENSAQIASCNHSKLA